MKFSRKLSFVISISVIFFTLSLGVKLFVPQSFALDKSEDETKTIRKNIFFPIDLSMVTEGIPKNYGNMVSCEMGEFMEGKEIEGTGIFVVKMGFEAKDGTIRFVRAEISFEGSKTQITQKVKQVKFIVFKMPRREE